jgi:hypothetical protein
MMQVGTSRRPADDPLRLALQPWARRLAFESVARWLLRGCACGLLAMAGVLCIGWFVPIAESELRPIAGLAALPLLLGALIVGAWPTSMLRRAWQIDTTACLWPSDSGPMR